MYEGTRHCQLNKPSTPVRVRLSKRPHPVVSLATEPVDGRWSIGHLLPYFPKAAANRTESDVHTPRDRYRAQDSKALLEEDRNLIKSQNAQDHHPNVPSYRSAK